MNLCTKMTTGLQVTYYHERQSESNVSKATITANSKLITSEGFTVTPMDNLVV